MKKIFLFILALFLIVWSAHGVDATKEDIISADKTFSALISDRKVDGDSLINLSIKKLGYERAIYFKDGVTENNAYLFSKPKDQFLILNIRYYPDKDFHFFSTNNIKNFFSHETTEFLPEWDVDDVNLLTLTKNVHTDSYEGVMRFELIVDSLYNKASWRITSSSVKERDENISFISILEKTVTDNQKIQ